MKTIFKLLVIFLTTGLSANAQSTFDKAISEAVKHLKCAEPSEEEPVILNAMLLAEKDSIAVILKARIGPGWHIYQYVPANMPYIPIDHILQLPEGLKALGKWMISSPFPSAADKGVLIYEEEAWFVHKVHRGAAVKAGSIITTGLYYQTCDIRQCLPPAEKTFELKI